MCTLPPILHCATSESTTTRFWRTRELECLLLVMVSMSRGANLIVSHFCCMGKVRSSSKMLTRTSCQYFSRFASQRVHQESYIGEKCHEIMNKGLQRLRREIFSASVNFDKDSTCVDCASYPLISSKNPRARKNGN